MAVAVSAAMVALYALFVKWFERHPARDIPFQRLAGDTLRGLAVGFCFFVAVVLVMFVFGIYRFDGFYRFDGINGFYRINGINFIWARKPIYSNDHWWIWIVLLWKYK